AISSRATNIGCAVPINQAVAILPQLKTRGSVSRGFIGVVLTDVTPDLQRSLKLPVSRGALVQDVNDDSPASRAGLKPYDIILTVDGREIWTNEELIRDISGRQPGTAARLDLLRDGHRQTTQVKLVERPADVGTPDERLNGARPSGGPRTEPDDRPIGLTARRLDRGFVRGMEVPRSGQR